MAPRIARTIVSTDDDAIAETARAYGGDVPFRRPDDLSRDDTPMMPVLEHALREMERIESRRFESVLLLDPTSPGRTPEDIERSFSMLESDPHARGVVACSEPTFNPFWVGVVERDGYMRPAFGGADAYRRRQDVPRFLRINGALYLWRREFVLARSETWSTQPHRALVLPEERAFSIDTLFEFEVAELLIERGKIELPWMAPAADGGSSHGRNAS